MSRIPAAPVDPLFVNRWSPLAFSSEPLTEEQISVLFEAARWSPSSFNEQPWLFVYADTEKDLGEVRPLLVDANRSWADRAPLLVFVFAKRHFFHNGNANPCAVFDTGAASMSLILQGEKLGLRAHAMGGILKDKCYQVLDVPEEKYEVICAIAIGKHGNTSLLTASEQQRETLSERKPVSSFAFKRHLTES